MLNHIEQHYNDLTLKGHLILRILLDHYGDENGLTRRQIAQALGQRRLYPHDDKALQQLESAGFVHVSVHRLRDYLAQHLRDDSVLKARQIRMYTVFHLYWLNGAYYAPLVALIQQHDSPRPRRRRGRK